MNEATTTTTTAKHRVTGRAATDVESTCDPDAAAAVVYTEAGSAVYVHPAYTESVVTAYYVVLPSPASWSFTPGAPPPPAPVVWYVPGSFRDAVNTAVDVAESA